VNDLDFATLIPFWIIEGLMAVFAAWLVKKGSEIKTPREAVIVLFLLYMMAEIFVSVVIYLYFPGVLTGIILADWVLMMWVAFFSAVFYYLGPKTLDEPVAGIVRVKSLIIALIIALVLLSEVFMAWAFALIVGDASTAGGVFTTIANSSSSFWFVFMTSTEMAITLFFIRNRLPKAFGVIMAFQTVIMILAPTAIANPFWADFSLAVGSVVMIFLFIYIFEFLYKNRTISSGILNYLLFLMVTYSVMMAGQFIWLLNGDTSVFVLSIIVEMVVYFGIVLDEKKLVSPPRRWQSKPYWVFGILIFLFAAEFFMGAVLDIQAYGTGFFTDMTFASMGGSFVNALSAGFFNFIKFFSTITLSPWYLIMMGIEMGALVALRIKHTRELETKVMFVLMILAYGVYTLLLPYFLIPANLLGQVPWIGWNMGIGTAGAIAPTIIIALLGTYLVSGILSFFFGSRQLCSIMCMAPLMYQGTTIDAMKSFNGTSKLARRLLTNKISSFYKVAISAVWISLLVVAVMSYLASVGVLNISVFGMDPAFFLYLFYFGFLWYVLWMLIPFVGTYGCASTGMCGWGAFNQCISRVGLFRLKVKDQAICVQCKTKDCGKVCPTGLTDLPSEFIAKGEYRNYKCIGCGNCVSACPYQIMSFYDVRHWLRERLGK
jgi:polyferredoxin